MSQGPHNIIFNPVNGEPRCAHCGVVPPFAPGPCPNNVIPVQPQAVTGLTASSVPKLKSVRDTDKPVYLCSITQDFDESDVITIDNCELLIDSGNTACDLLLSYHDAKKFKLRVTKYMKTINQAEGTLGVAMMIPALFVQFALAGADGNVTVKSTYLDAWVKLNEVPDEALPREFRERICAERAKDAAEKASGDDFLASSTPLAAAPATPEKVTSAVSKFADVPVNNPTPVKHMAHGSANLGKSGAKKLMLMYDFAANEIFFMEDALDFPEL